MTFKELVSITLGFIIGFLLLLLIDGSINKKYVSYKTVYEHNITIKQLPIKKYGRYILDRKYQESVKELEEQNADIK
jgi:hypothetical protein